MRQLAVPPLLHFLRENILIIINILENSESNHIIKMEMLLYLFPHQILDTKKSMSVLVKLKGERSYTNENNRIQKIPDY